ncbi:hypothetical protein FB645_005427 [Coemansia sp. IMI 203386]|nr:hypothetical protein FB645_005427 [Coemansia sp. IMI 203386]
MSSSADHHVYAQRFPAPHQHLEPSAWPRNEQYPRQPMALQMRQPPQQQQYQQHRPSAWPNNMGSGYILPPPCSRTTTVSPPAQQQHQQSKKSTSPYALPPLAMPITPMTSVTPPMIANPVVSHEIANVSSAKRRRRAVNPDNETSSVRRRREQHASPPLSSSQMDGQKNNAVVTATEVPATDEPTEAEAARILEERRRRNASASARFRKRRNERERELVNRCVFLEQQLLQAVGTKLFDEIIRKAPSAQTSTGDGASLLVAARRSMVAGGSSVAAFAYSATSSRAPSPRDEDEFADDVEDDLIGRQDHGSGISVSALTAPRSVDDVWSAYLTLNQQMAGALQRIAALESSSSKD